MGPDIFSSSRQNSHGSRSVCLTRSTSTELVGRMEHASCDWDWDRDRGGRTRARRGLRLPGRGIGWRVVGSREWAFTRPRCRRWQQPGRVGGGRLAVMAQMAQTSKDGSFNCGQTRADQTSQTSQANESRRVEPRASCARTPVSPFTDRLRAPGSQTLPRTETGRDETFWCERRAAPVGKAGRSVHRERAARRTTDGLALRTYPETRSRELELPRTCKRRMIGRRHPPCRQRAACVSARLASLCERLSHEWQSGSIASRKSSAGPTRGTVCGGDVASGCAHHLAVAAGPNARYP